MISWIKSLYTTKKEALIEVPYKVEIKKPRVTPDIRNRVVIDRNINGLKYRQLAVKYGIGESTAWRIVKNANLRIGEWND